MADNEIKRAGRRESSAQALRLNLLLGVAASLNGEVLLVDGAGAVADVIHAQNLPHLHQLVADVGNIYDLPGMPAELADLALQGYPFTGFALATDGGEMRYTFSCRAFDEADSDDPCGIVVVLKPLLPPSKLPKMDQSLFTATFNTLMGSDQRFAISKKRAVLFAATDKRILIQGESGTGKELMAQAIHNASRPFAPYVKINCASLTHEHAMRFLAGFIENKQIHDGVLSTVRGGTLVLDNIDKLRPSVQPLVMQFLDESEITPVGGAEPVKLDFRLISTSTKDIVANLGNSNVRGDLLFRLAHETIDIPPLRERQTDILPIARRMLDRHCAKQGLQTIPLSTGANELLLSYRWPGNIRELESVLTQASRLCGNGPIRPEHIERRLVTDESQSRQDQPSASFHTLKDQERLRIVEAYEQTNRNVAEAAALLSMSKTTFYRRLKEYGLK